MLGKLRNLPIGLKVAVLSVTMTGGALITMSAFHMVSMEIGCVFFIRSKFGFLDRLVVKLTGLVMR